MITGQSFYDIIRFVFVSFSFPTASALLTNVTFLLFICNTLPSIFHLLSTMGLIFFISFSLTRTPKSFILVIIIFIFVNCFLPLFAWLLSELHRILSVNHQD